MIVFIVVMMMIIMVMILMMMMMIIMIYIITIVMIIAVIETVIGKALIIWPAGTICSSDKKKDTKYKVPPSLNRNAHKGEF